MVRSLIKNEIICSKISLESGDCDIIIVNIY